MKAFLSLACAVSLLFSGQAFATPVPQPKPEVPVAPTECPAELPYVWTAVAELIDSGKYSSALVYSHEMAVRMFIVLNDVMHIKAVAPEQVIVVRAIDSTVPEIWIAVSQGCGVGRAVLDAYSADLIWTILTGPPVKEAGWTM